MAGKCTAIFGTVDCSNICTWPLSWTFQILAPNSGFGLKSPWMVFTFPCFSAAVCLLHMNDGCWLRYTSPVGLDIIWTVSFIVFTCVLLVLVQAMLCSPLGILGHLSILFQPPFLPTYWSWNILPLQSLAFIWYSLSTCCHLASFILFFFLGSIVLSSRGL